MTETAHCRTWTHSDLRPLNILYLASIQVQPVDLELGSFGHALLDGVCVRMAFPPRRRRSSAPGSAYRGR